MNYKTTYWLFGLLAVLVLVLGVVLYRGPGTDENKGAYVLPSVHDPKNPLKPDQITRVEIQQKDGPTLAFERPEGSEKWQITSPRPLAADNTHIDDLVREVLDARQQSAPARDLKSAGLDKPDRVIILQGAEREVRLNLGETTPGAESGVIYVTSSDLPKKPLAVRLADLSASQKDLAFFRSHDLLGRDTADVQSLKVSEGKRVVMLEKGEGHWRMVDPPYGTIDPGQLLDKVGDLRVEKDEDFVAQGVTGLAKYHLGPRDDTLRLTVGRAAKGKKGKTLTLQTLVVGIARKAEAPKKKDRKSEEPKEDKYYAYLDTPGKGKDIVKVPANAVEPFTKLLDDPGSLRNKNLVQLDNFRQPDAIDVQNSYGKLEFRRPEPGRPWQLYRAGKVHPVDDAEVQLLVSSLTKKDQVQSFPDPKDARRKKELGLAGETDTTVTVWADALQKPDKKDKKGGKPKFKKGVKPAAVLRFGNREGKLAAVERVWGKDRTVVMVPDEVREQVRKGPLAYFDRALPQFNPAALDATDNVSRFVLERDDTKYTVTREKSSQSGWKITTPKKLADRSASEETVRDILSSLNKLRAVEVVAEKADAKALPGYGLKAPPYRVVVTVTKGGKGDKGTPTTYDFGKEAGGKGVYAKVSGKDTIYLVDNSIIGTLRKDLQDPTVFRFDADKVQTLTLKGWRKSTGIKGGSRLVMVRKDGKWTAREPADFELDPEKVNEFLRSISTLKAERFLPQTTATRKKAALNLEQDALDIEITLANKKDKKDQPQLRVGGPDGDRQYYATSRQVKGDIFTVPRDLFEKVRSSRGFFSK
jgi:hypothetical protein